MTLKPHEGKIACGQWMMELKRKLLETNEKVEQYD
jgi:hypothetical protein